jgi:OHCU decarboxylase
MLDRMPFSDLAHALDTGDKIWAGLSESDWQEAFRHHPAIGASRANKKQSVAAKRWSKGEQSTAKKSDPQTLETLAQLNAEYRTKFGYVFLICATGKSSDEILAALRHRMHNDSAVELRVATEEQRKITRIRLEKLLAP